MSDSGTSRRGFLAVLLAGGAGVLVLGDDTGDDEVFVPAFPSSDFLEVSAGERVTATDDAYAAVRAEKDGAISLKNGDGIRLTIGE